MCSLASASIMACSTSSTPLRITSMSPPARASLQGVATVTGR
jgi:hypothetical protein